MCVGLPARCSLMQPGAVRCSSISVPCAACAMATLICPVLFRRSQASACLHVPCFKTQPKPSAPPYAFPLFLPSFAPIVGHALIRFICPRVFASLHLLALYVAMCGQLPGLGFLQQPELEALLKLIGIWHPSVHRCALPCLSLNHCTRCCCAGGSSRGVQWRLRFLGCLSVHARAQSSLRCSGVCVGLLRL